MIQSLYTAASGMSSQQKNIDNIANNIANVNTTGYKSSKVEFKDAIYRTMLSPNEDSQENNLQQGHGALVSSINKNYTQGFIEETGNSLDFAIIGNGFFALEGRDGVLYTRDGNFKVSLVDGNSYLVNSDGNYVLDRNLNRIVVEGNIEEIELRDLNLGIFNFSNPEGLLAVGKNNFSPSEASGEAVLLEEAKVRQQHLEMSNVDLATELSSLIRAQRAYQAAARAISTADEMESMANNLRR